jgi:membrane protease YdiL (CAAX protease family)
MKKLKAIVFGILIFLAAEAIQIVVVFGSSMVYGIILGFHLVSDKGAEALTDTSSYMDELINAMSQNILYSLSVFGVAVCGVAFFFWYKHEIRGEVRGKLQDLFKKMNVLLFLFLGIGSQFFITGLLSLIQPFFKEIFADYSEQLQMLTDGNDIVVLLLAVLIAPVCEELIFRGMILHRVNRDISFWGANVLQALLFGIYHMNLLQGIYAALLGFLLGVVYRKFRTIFASIFLHIIINASSFLVMLAPEGNLSYLVITFSGLILISVTLYFIKPLKTVL